MIFKDDDEKRIEEMLKKGKSRKRIAHILKEDMDQGRLLFYLNNIPDPNNKDRYLVVNLVLCGLLAFITARKLAIALGFGQFDIYAMLALVVPVINIYIFMEISKFRRIGYQFLAVLSALSLVNPENQHLPEIIILPSMTVISGFMYFRLFPRKQLLREL